MCRIDLPRSCRLAVGILMGLAVNAAARADDTGVVRISDRSAKPVVRAQSPEPPLIVPADCEVGGVGTTGAGPTYGPYCPPHGVPGPSHGLVIGTSPTWDADDCRECRNGWDQGGGGMSGGVIDCPHCHFGEDCPHCRGRGYLDLNALGNHDTGNIVVDCFAKGCDKLLGFVHDRFNFEQAGGGGAGVPLFGHYCMTYPVDPNYFDGRDGQVYAAQGYGGPISVPLAPVVRHTYNYGWGIPSSRLTPISHPVAPGVSPAPSMPVPQIQQTRFGSR